MTRTRLLAALLASVLALGLGACGSDDDEGDTTTSTAPAAQSAGSGDGAQGEAGKPAAGEDADAAGSPPSSDSGADGGGGGGPKDYTEVDLSVDPGKIRGSVVTDTGAVQTLEPDTEDHETAQENSYSSIKAFGEEAEGEEATNITFGLVQYLDAKARGDWATACARLYSVLRESLEKQAEGGGCTEVLGTLMSRSSQATREEAAKIDVSSVRRGEENRAFVIYKTPQTLSADMPMYVEEGDWKVGAIEAYTLKPEQLE